MTNMTFVVPEELHQIMQRHKEVKWSEVARQAMWEQARKIDLMDKILSKSKFTDKDALILGRKINESIAKKHGLIK